MVMGRLNLLPHDYYDLTGPETAALLKGVDDRQLDSWRRVRRVATLIRNAHFTNPEDEFDYMPLPGDEAAIAEISEAEMERQFFAFAAALGGTVTIE